MDSDRGLDGYRGSGKIGESEVLSRAIRFYSNSAWLKWKCKAGPRSSPSAPIRVVRGG